MKTLMEQGLECVVNIFHQYCFGKHPDDYLQPGEFKKMLKEQAQPFLKDTTPDGVSQDAYIDQLFKKADRDHNGKLKFTEVIVVVAGALIDAHNRSHGHEHGHGHGHSHDDGHGHGHSH
ncbi:protein S100-A12 [Pogona vitticeps]